MAAWIGVGAVLDAVCFSGLNAALDAGPSGLWGLQFSIIATTAPIVVILWAVHAAIMPSLVVKRTECGQGRRLDLLGFAFVIVSTAAGWTGHQVGFTLFFILMFANAISDATVYAFTLLPLVLCGMFVGMALHPFLRAVLTKGARVSLWQNILGVTPIYVLPFVLTDQGLKLGPFKALPSATMAAMWWAIGATAFLLHLWFVGQAVGRSLREPMVNAPVGA